MIELLPANVPFLRICFAQGGGSSMPDPASALASQQGLKEVVHTGSGNLTVLLGCDYPNFEFREGVTLYYDQRNRLSGNLLSLANIKPPLAPIFKFFFSCRGINEDFVATL